MSKKCELIFSDKPKKARFEPNSTVQDSVRYREQSFLKLHKAKEFQSPEKSLNENNDWIKIVSYKSDEIIPNFTTKIHKGYKTAKNKPHKNKSKVSSLCSYLSQDRMKKTIAPIGSPLFT